MFNVLEVGLGRGRGMVGMDGEGCGKDGDGGVEVKGYCGSARGDGKECRRGRGS